MLNPIRTNRYPEADLVKLTGRQRQYLEETISLQAENSGESIHYSALANRLGVSTISAYNMLRVLEQKGCLRSCYELSGLGIGRSSVLFEVTSTGRNLAG